MNAPTRRAPGEEGTAMDAPTRPRRAPDEDGTTITAPMTHQRGGHCNERPDEEGTNEERTAMNAPMPLSVWVDAPMHSNDVGKQED